MLKYCQTIHEKCSDPKQNTLYKHGRSHCLLLIMSRERMSVNTPRHTAPNLNRCDRPVYRPVGVSGVIMPRPVYRPVGVKELKGLLSQEWVLQICFINISNVSYHYSSNIPIFTRNYALTLLNPSKIIKQMSFIVNEDVLAYFLVCVFSEN